MPALRRKRRRFPLLPQLPPPSAAKGNTGFASVSCPCRCPVFPPALSIRQTFQVFNLNPCQLFDRLPDHIFAVSMHALARTGMHYHRRPFSAKSRASVAPPICSKTIFPSYLFCQPFISQNLRIILTRNHRRRCGNDFIADARSAPASRRFLPNLQPLMSPSAGYPTAPPPPGNDVGNIAAADARRMHGINLVFAGLPLLMSKYG